MIDIYIKNKYGFLDLIYPWKKSSLEKIIANNIFNFSELFRRKLMGRPRIKLRSCIKCIRAD